ncbi:MAG: DUF2335 domain-containing protein [Siphonobacter aquaeclarae]|nr:DUF2335 domain-containing protein [Siphonobacter aquaeclarae]
MAQSKKTSRARVEVEEEMLKALPELQNMPPARRKAYLEFVQQHTFSGPLPDPDSVRQFNEVIRDGAERIMVMAEKEQEFQIWAAKDRHDLTRQEQKNSNRLAVTGQWMAFVVTLCAFGGCGYLAINDHDTIAGIIGGTTVVALVGAFISTRKKAKE